MLAYNFVFFLTIVVFFHLEVITGLINELIHRPIPCRSLSMTDL